ncbi:MAG TPA: molybdate ABC transporter substrate-binding protein [Stellaceae bacterium]|nr:molybdate ABC transporter substrate-binding protein [Stellaceae bacterium]
MKHLALAVAALLAAAPHGVRAGEITLIAPGGIRAALDALVPSFQQKTGNTVTMTFASGGGTRDQVVRGAAYDVAILEPPLDAVIASGHVVAKSATPLASAAVGVALQPGRPKPRIATREDLRFLFLRANGISEPDAAHGAAAAESFAATLEKLGLAERVKPHLHVATNGREAMAMLARGEVDVGVTFVSEMVGMPGIEIVGALPAEFSARTRYIAFVSTTAHDPDAAQALVAHLGAAAAAAAYKTSGMEPAHPGK